MRRALDPGLNTPHQGASVSNSHEERRGNLFERLHKILEIERNKREEEERRGNEAEALPNCESDQSLRHSLFGVLRATVELMEVEVRKKNDDDNPNAEVGSKPTVASNHIGVIVKSDEPLSVSIRKTKDTKKGGQKGLFLAFSRPQLTQASIWLP
ncbi:hypothetical protein JHK86_016290 [Glycine max]|nr:hypothetical protein JHK86_016290 [Glycine max]